jgi:hypothetical protein
MEVGKEVSHTSTQTTRPVKAARTGRTRDEATGDNLIVKRVVFSDAMNDHTEGPGGTQSLSHRNSPEVLTWSTVCETIVHPSLHFHAIAHVEIVYES